MNIVFCTDKNYIMPCGVMLTSICENNKNIEIYFHAVIDQNVSDTQKLQLSNVISQYEKKHIDFTIFDNTLLKGLKTGNTLRWSLTVFYRLYFCDLFPNIDKILFLDGDLVVVQSLNELWNTDISHCALACVPDMSSSNMDIYYRLQYSSDYGYFNAGVLLFNLKYWRVHHIKEKLLNYLCKYSERCLYNDQDVMNAILHEKKVFLPLKYNVQDGFFYASNKNFDTFKYKEQLCEAAYKPIIIHFTAYIKPWMKSCYCPFRDIFIKYKNLTQWKDVSLINIGNPFVRWIKHPLIKLGLKCGFFTAEQFKLVYDSQLFESIQNRNLVS